MWNSDDPKSKWLHLVVKLVAALIIFKLGVLVGEFKMIKAMVLRNDAHPRMLFKGDGEGGGRFFQKGVMPMMEGNRMFWRGERADQPSVGAPVPPPVQ